MSNPSITASLSNNVIVAKEGSTNINTTINYSITPLSPYNVAIISYPPNGETNLLSLKFTTQASNELKVSGNLFINGDEKNTQQEWFDLLPFFSGYFVDNEYHPQSSNTGHRSKIYKLSFTLDSFLYGSVTTLFPNDYKTQNPNPQPALRYDQATTYYLTKIKEIGEYTTNFNINTVMLYGFPKKVIANEYNKPIDFFNLYFKDEITNNVITYQSYINGEYSIYKNNFNVKINNNTYRFPYSILNNFSGIFFDASNNKKIDIVWNVLTGEDGVTKYIQPLINNSGNYTEFNTGSYNLKKELNCDFLDVGNNLSKNYSLQNNYIGENIISLKVPKYVTGSTFSTTVSNNFELKELSLTITDKELLTVSLSSDDNIMFIGDEKIIDVSYTGLQSAVISYPGVEDISLNNFKFKLQNSLYGSSIIKNYTKINGNILYNNININSANWNNLSYLTGNYIDIRSGIIYNFKEFKKIDNLTLGLLTEPLLPYNDINYEYNLIQININIESISFSIDTQNNVRLGSFKLNNNTLTTNDMLKMVYIKGKYLNNLNNIVYKITFEIINNDLKVTSIPSLSQNIVYNFTYLNKNEKLNTTTNKIRYTGESNFLNSQKIRLLSFAPDGYNKELDTSFNINVNPLPVIDGSLNKNLISSVVSDNITTLNLNYNITNLINNQTIILQKPPVSNINLTSIKIKIKSRDGVTNNYYLEGGIIINDIEYNTIQEWNKIYNWLDGYFVNNLDRTLYGGNNLKIEFRQYGSDSLQILTNRNDIEIEKNLYFTKISNIIDYVVVFKTANDNNLSYSNYTDNNNFFKIYNNETDAINNYNILYQNATDFALIFNNLSSSSIFKDINSNTYYTITTTQQTVGQQQNVVVFNSTPVLNSNTVYKLKLVTNSIILNNNSGSYTYTADSNFIGNQELSLTVPKYGISKISNNNFIKEKYNFTVLSKGILSFIVQQNLYNVKVSENVNINYTLNHGVCGIVSKPGTSDISLNFIKFKLQTQYTNNYNTIAGNIIYNNENFVPTQDKENRLSYLIGEYMDIQNGNVYNIDEFSIFYNNTYAVKSNPLLPINNSDYEFNLVQINTKVKNISFTISQNKESWLDTSENHIINNFISINLNNSVISDNNTYRLRHLIGNYLDVITKKVYRISDIYYKNTNKLIIKSSLDFELGKTYNLEKQNTNEKLDITKNTYTYVGNENYLDNQKIRFTVYGEGLISQIVNDASVNVINSFTLINQETSASWLHYLNMSSWYFDCYNIDMVNSGANNYYILSGYYGNNKYLSNIYLKENMTNAVISKINIGDNFDYSKVKIMKFPSTINNTSTTLSNCNLIIGLKKENINNEENRLSIVTFVVNKLTGLIESNWNSNTKDLSINFLPEITSDKDVSITSEFYNGLTGTGINPVNETTLLSAKIKENMLLNSVQPIQNQNTDYYIKISDVENELKVGMKVNISNNIKTITNVSLNSINNVMYWFVRFDSDLGSSIPTKDLIFSYKINVTSNSNWINIIKVTYRDSTKSGFPIGTLIYCMRFTNNGLVDRIGLIDDVLENTNYVTTKYNSINNRFINFRGNNNEDLQQLENGILYNNNNILLRNTKSNNLIIKNDGFSSYLSNNITLSGSKINNNSEEFIDCNLLQKGEIIITRAINNINTSKNNFSGKKVYRLTNNNNNINLIELKDVLTNQDRKYPSNYNFIDSRIFINSLLNMPLYYDVIKENNNTFIKVKVGYDDYFQSWNVNDGITKNWGAISRDGNMLYIGLLYNNVITFIKQSLNNWDIIPKNLKNDEYSVMSSIQEAVNSPIKIIWKSLGVFATSYKLKLYRDNELITTTIVNATTEEYQIYNGYLNDFGIVETHWDKCGNSTVSISGVITTLIDYSSQSGLNQYESNPGTFSLLLPKILLSECKPFVIYTSNASNVEPVESNRMRAAKRLALASNRYYRR